ncbi:MAG: helix-turn-helix transcriptional regulator [Clostridia bacterium]|nr:helix-turn-helix transcriptional regulator [Clostridia bacterium]
MSIEIEYIENRVENLMTQKLTNVYRDYRSNDPNYSKRSFSFHSHKDMHEICICYTPFAIIFCGERIERMSGNFAVFYPANVMHLQLNHPHSLYKRFFVRYPKEMLPEPENGDSELSGFFCTALSQDDMTLINPCTEMMTNLSKREKNEYTEEQKRQLTEFLLLKLEECISKKQITQDNKPEIKEKDEARIREICKYINTHYNEKLTLESIAKKHFMSKVTLTRLFRNKMKTSVNEYLNSIRYSNAIMFLENGFSVKETAVMCGYSDQSYFTKAFKNISGETPHSYQKKAKKGIK